VTLEREEKVNQVTPRAVIRLVRGEPLSPAEKLRRRKNKVRSAWISFIGRIVAQVVGAIASVSLGLMFLNKYHSEKIAPPAPTIAHASSARLATQRPPREPGALALAVMPIQNFSKDAARGYFADGVTEALITELAQIEGLQVTSRTSSMAYKATTKSLPDIARELDVDLILEGSVVQDQDVVRVTAQLIDARSDQHLWARSYDRSIRNLLTVQAEVAKIIVKDVHSALGHLIHIPAAFRARSVS
jgi:TolB-like protein